MTLIAQLDYSEEPALVVTLYDYGADPVPPHMAPPEYIDVTDEDPRPAPGFTYDGETFSPGVPQANEATRQAGRDELYTAISDNDDYLASDAPDVAAQVRALTEQANLLIRGTLQEYGDVSPPPPLPERRIDSIDPTEGPAAGGTEITLTGAGFTNIGGVRFEGETTQWAASFDVVDDATLTCTTPPGADTVDVVAFNGDPGDAVLTDGFTYLP